MSVQIVYTLASLILLVGIAALYYTTINPCEIRKNTSFVIYISHLGDTTISWRWRLSAAWAAASLWSYRALIRNPLGTLNFRTQSNHSLFRMTTLQKCCTVANMSSFPLITSVLSFLPTTLEDLAHNKMPKNQGCFWLN